MLNCITNSGILKSSLELVSIDDYDEITKEEFEKMCTRFGLDENQMIPLVTNLDISLLENHYETIWDGLNYYSMACIDEYKNKYIETLFNCDLTDDRIELLCDDLKEYIKSNSCINAKDNKCNTFKNACNNHHDTCVKYLLNNPHKHDGRNDMFDQYSCYYNSNIIDYISICGGSLDVIKYAFENQKKDCTTYAIDYASFKGNLGAVKYLFEIQKKDCTTYAIDWASQCGHLDVVKYLFEIQKKDCTTNAIDWACKYGQLDVVKYLFEIQKKDCTIDAIRFACIYGHLDIMKYLLEIRNKDYTIDAYLLEIRHKDYTFNIYLCAFMNGHVDIIAYLSSMKQKMRDQ